MMLGSLVALVGLLAIPVSGDGKLPKAHADPPLEFGLTSLIALALRHVEEGVAIPFGDFKRDLAPRGKQLPLPQYNLNLTDSDTSQTLSLPPPSH
jgi:hypothetical protein